MHMHMVLGDHTHICRVVRTKEVSLHHLTGQGQKIQVCQQEHVADTSVYLLGFIEEGKGWWPSEWVA